MEMEPDMVTLMVSGLTRATTLKSHQDHLNPDMLIGFINARIQINSVVLRSEGLQYLLRFK